MAGRRAWVLAVGFAAFGAFGAIAAATGLAALAEAPKGGYLPDPPPHASKVNWLFEITAREGKVSVERARAVVYERAAETPRVIGRFAIELYIGQELLDRVRFNAPLMGGEPTYPNRNGLPKPRFDLTVSARTEARMADNQRASYVLVVDRESGDTQKFFWPPEADGHLVPWRSFISDASPGDFPDASVRAAGLRDGGASPDGGR